MIVACLENTRTTASLEDSNKRRQKEQSITNNKSDHEEDSEVIDWFAIIASLVFAYYLIRCLACPMHSAWLLDNYPDATRPQKFVYTMGFAAVAFFFVATYAASRRRANKGGRLLFPGIFGAAGVAVLAVSVVLCYLHGAED